MSDVVGWSRETPGGWLYLAVSPTNYNRAKIGVSVNPLRRIAELRRGEPDLCLHCAYFIPSTYGNYYAVEASLKQEFDDVRVSFLETDAKSEFVRMHYEDLSLRVEGFLDDWTPRGHPPIRKYYPEDLTIMLEEFSHISGMIFGAGFGTPI